MVYPRKRCDNGLRYVNLIPDCLKDKIMVPFFWGQIKAAPHCGQGIQEDAKW